MKQVATGTGHIISVSFGVAGGITVTYDSQKVASAGAGFLGFSGANCVFQVKEDGAIVSYECSTRVAFAMDDHLTVRRNGIAIYTD